MITIASLWLPIVLSAVTIFVVSSLIHTVLGYHWNDLRRVPNEAALLDALRPLHLPAGDYHAPRPKDAAHMRTPEYKEQVQRGPTVLMTVTRGSFGMGRQLSQWFVYLLLVSFCCAYVASRSVPAGAPYLAVFRLAGCSAFLAYSLALPQASIWYSRNWRMTVITMIDGLIYAGITGGFFGWLWPR
jgi:hypothetical protein